MKNDNVDELSEEEINKLSKPNLLALIKADKLRRNSNTPISNTQNNTVTMEAIERLLNTKLNELSQDFAKRYELLERDFDSLNKKIADITEENKAIRAELAPLKQAINTNTTEKIRETNETVQLDWGKELALREHKKLNLILFGIQEEQNEKKDELSTKVKQICDALEINCTFQKTHRIGQEQSTRPRPTIVVLPDLDSKRKLLSKATKLRTLPNLSNVYISPDLTAEQRKQQKSLRDELKRLKSIGENVKIKDNKIVKAQ